MGAQNFDRGFLVRSVLRETRANLTHFRILILCLFLGVFVIGLVNSVTQALEGGLRRDGKAILGGDLSVRNIYEPLKPEQEAILTQAGRVAHTIEMRALLTDAAGANAALTEIKGIDAPYPLFGRMELEAAGPIDSPYAFLNDAARRDGDRVIPAVLLDGALAERLGVKAGDLIRAGSQDFVVADLIKVEPDRAGGQTFSIGPRSMVRIEDMAATGLVQTGAQVYYHYKLALHDPDALKDINNRIEQSFAQAGGWRLRDYTEASPRVQTFLDRLAMFFTLVGLSALLIGGVGIGNAVHVVLEKRLVSLAIAKSLGASRQFVFLLWLGVVLMVGLVGIVPALTLAFAVPYLLAAPLAAAFSLPFAPSLAPLPILAAATFGVVILILFSVLPLSRAAQAKPALLFRQGVGAGLNEKAGPKAGPAMLWLVAISSGVLIVTSPYPEFVGGFLVVAALIYGLLKAVNRGLIKGLARLTHLRRPTLRMAIVNMIRPDGQSFVVLLSLGLSLTLFAAIAQIETNIRHRVESDIPDKAPAFFFIDIQKSQMPEFETLVTGMDGVSDLEKVPNLRGRIVAVNGVEAEKALVDRSEDWLLRGDRGFTYLSKKPEDSDLLEGEWWPADYSGEPIVSVVEDVARGFNVGVGDRITVNIMGRDITATIASVRSVDWSTMTINYAITFAPGVLDNAPHSYLATIVAPPQIETQILVAVANAFPNVTAIQVREALQVVSDILRKIAAAMRAIAGLALATGVLVLAASLLSSLRQRRYETVVMKVVGAKRTTLTAMMLYEFAMLGVIAAGLSLVTGTASAWLVVTQVMDFPWRFDIVTAVLVVGIALCITLGFSAWAVWRTLASRPGDFLRNE